MRSALVQLRGGPPGRPCWLRLDSGEVLLVEDVESLVVRNTFVTVTANTTRSISLASLHGIDVADGWAWTLFEYAKGLRQRLRQRLWTGNGKEAVPLREAVEAMLFEYKSIRLPELEQEGLDTLRVEQGQFGILSSKENLPYSVSITRQLMSPDADDPQVWHVIATSNFSPTGDLRALAHQPTLFWEGVEQAAAGVDALLNSRSIKLLEYRLPLSLDLDINMS